MRPGPLSRPTPFEAPPPGAEGAPFPAKPSEKVEVQYSATPTRVAFHTPVDLNGTALRAVTAGQVKLEVESGLGVWLEDVRARRLIPWSNIAELRYSALASRVS